jgi:hypothetical protein
MSSAENSFGLPSGHAQNAVVIWGTLANRIKTRWAWIITIIVMFLIGLSRLYLAVHFPIDVLLGWLFGIAVLWLLIRLEQPVVRWIKKFSTYEQIMIAFLLSLFLTTINLLPMYSLASWNLPTNWAGNALLSFPDEPAITPLSPHNILSTPGALFGLAAGWIWIQRKGGFSTRDLWWRLIVRYLVGLIGVLVLYAGLGSLFPETETLMAYLLRYVRYALIGFWISGFAPWLFLQLKLASSSLPVSIETKQAG